jgi:hypothetical protein
MMPIDLGTCVRFCPWDCDTLKMSQDGVIIEIIPPGKRMKTPGVRKRRFSRKTKVRRYVIQCGTVSEGHKVVRRADEMVVVAL